MTTRAELNVQLLPFPLSSSDRNTHNTGRMATCQRTPGWRQAACPLLDSPHRQRHLSPARAAGYWLRQPRSHCRRCLAPYVPGPSPHPRWVSSGWKSACQMRFPCSRGSPSRIKFKWVNWLSNTDDRPTCEVNAVLECVEVQHVPVICTCELARSRGSGAIHSDGGDRPIEDTCHLTKFGNVSKI